jgi:ABC-type nitrate/sulfonate/bicarbonate transport system substrate-binding protein
MAIPRLAPTEVKTCFLFATLCVILFTVAVAGPAWGQRTDNPRKVLIGTTGIQMATFPVMITKSQGFYRDEGLEVDLVVMRPDLAIKAVVTGDVHFATPFTNAIRAAMSGYPMRMLMALMTGTDHSLVVKPSIKRVEDLKGKKLAVSAPGATPDASTRIILKKYGLVPDVDTTILFMSGGSTLRFAAVQGGSVDGALMSSPYNKMLVQQGFRELVYMKDLINIPFNGLSANTKFIKSNPEIVARTIRATLRGILFIKQNKDESLKFMSQSFGFKDREIASLVYDAALPLFPDSGIPSDASMRETMEAGKEIQGIAREISVAEVADWSFAQKAYKELQAKK